MNQESFALTSPNPAAPQPQLEQQMQMTYTPDGGAAGVQVGPYRQMPDGSFMVTHTGNSGRKRGRPRKYGPDGNMNIVSLPQQQPTITAAVPPQLPPPQIFSSPAARPPSAAVQTEANPPVDGPASPSSKKSRGRPRGSKNKRPRLEASGSGNSGLEFLLFKESRNVNKNMLLFPLV